MERQVSILIFNHPPELLEKIFHLLFSSHVSAALEVIYADDSEDCRTWIIAAKYLRLYPSQITITRHTVPIERYRKQANLLRMATCRVYASTYQQTDVDIEKIVNEVDDYLKYGYKNKLSKINLNHRNIQLSVRRPESKKPALIKQNHASSDERVNPLVSITVHNYNYGRFLKDCLESVVSQSYKNLQIIFSDNASDDDSWEIASNFFERYPNKFTIIRNRVNMGSKANYQNCEFHIRGDYYLQLCSDDYLAPTCIETCVNLLRQNPDTGMLVFHRNIVDADGKVTHEPPFFDKSFKAPAGAMADVYLMSSINPSISQIFYNSQAGFPVLERTLIDRWFANRFRDFAISIQYSVIYCDQPLVYNRIHSENDSTNATKNLLEIIGPYVANIEFELTAGEHKKTLKNAEKSIQKLSQLSLRYASKALLSGDINLALRYLHLSAAIAPSSVTSDTYDQLQRALYGSHEEAAVAIAGLRVAPALLSRSVSYAPPFGACPL